MFAFFYHPRLRCDQQSILDMYHPKRGFCTYAGVLLARQRHFHCGQHSTYDIFGGVLFSYAYAQAVANLAALISDGVGVKHSDYSGSYSFVVLELQ
jgi:hypothetical protein